MGWRDDSTGETEERLRETLESLQASFQGRILGRDYPLQSQRRKLTSRTKVNPPPLVISPPSNLSVKASTLPSVIQSATRDPDVGTGPTLTLKRPQSTIIDLDEGEPRSKITRVSLPMTTSPFEHLDDESLRVRVRVSMSTIMLKFSQ